MKLQGIDFGPVWDASGARGWFGEGYWFHRVCPGLSFRGSAFVSKTTTLFSREGNMPLKGKRWGPKAWLPRCVYVKPVGGVVLNAVSLSGPGLDALLDTWRWQELRKPFLISFMPVGLILEERVLEVATFVEMILDRQHEFLSRFGVQINLSCPNTEVGHDAAELAPHSRPVLEPLQKLREAGIPVVVKLNVLFPSKVAAELEDLVDGWCVTNALPWGSLPDKIDWRGLFGDCPECGDGPEVKDCCSPLKQRGFGAGGLSGWPLLNLTAQWVRDAVLEAGVKKPINGGGGILNKKDVHFLMECGARSVFLGSVGILRGWRVRGLIQQARESSEFWERRIKYWQKAYKLEAK